MITFTRNERSIRVTFSGKHITTAKRPSQLMDALLSTRSMDVEQAKRWIERARNLPVGTAINLNTVVPKQKTTRRYTHV